MGNNSASYLRLQNICVIDVCSEIRFRGEGPPRSSPIEEIHFGLPRFTYLLSLLLLFLLAVCKSGERSFSPRGCENKTRNILLKCLPACESRVRAASWTFFFLRSSLWPFFLSFLFLIVGQQLDTVYVCVNFQKILRDRTNTAVRFYDWGNWNSLKRIKFFESKRERERKRETEIIDISHIWTCENLQFGVIWELSVLN